MQAGGGDPARGRGDGADRPQHPPGYHPAEREREHGHDGQRDAGLGQERVQIELARVQGFLVPLLAGEIRAQAPVVAGLAGGRILLPAVSRSNSQ